MPNPVGGQVLVFREKLINPVFFSFDIVVPPHSFAERVSYVVPATKLGLLATVHIAIFRETVATAVGNTEMKVVIYNSAGMSQNIYRIKRILNNVGDNDRLEFNPNVIIPTGFAVKILTQDASTGGTVHYWASLHIHEIPL